MWKYYPAIKDGLPLYIDGCDLRIGEPRASKPKNRGVWKWHATSDESFFVTMSNKIRKKRKFIARVNPNNDATTLDGTWWVYGKEPYRHYIFTEAVTGAWSNANRNLCATSNNQFAGTARKWGIKKDEDDLLEKCGNSVNKQCEGQTIPMDDEGW